MKEHRYRMSVFLFRHIVRSEQKDRTRRSFRINKTVRFDIVENLVQEFLCQIFCHAKVHIQIISAVLGRAPGISPSKSRMNSNISIISGTISLDS